jgi:hypothetical protein
VGVKLPLVVARLCTQTIRAVEEVASEGEGEGGTGVSTGVGLVSSNALGETDAGDGRRSSTADL